jgi:hypothetical protein
MFFRGASIRAWIGSSAIVISACNAILDIEEPTRRRDAGSGSGGAPVDGAFQDVLTGGDAAADASDAEFCTQAFCDNGFDSECCSCMQQLCAEGFQACGCSAACRDFVACVGQCAGVPACESICEDDHPGGMLAFNGLASCIAGGTCAAPCTN